VPRAKDGRFLTRASRRVRMTRLHMTHLEWEGSESPIRKLETEKLAARLQVAVVRNHDAEILVGVHRSVIDADFVV
jgi:hypothetical protein